MNREEDSPRARVECLPLCVELWVEFEVVRIECDGRGGDEEATAGRLPRDSRIPKKKSEGRMVVGADPSLPSPKNWWW